MAILGVLAFVAFGYWVYTTRREPHKVRAVFNQAVNVYPGEDVKANGADIGKISKVQYIDGQGVVTVGIRDNKFWPLHQGTTATIRFGTTIGNGTREVALEPGPASAPKIAENGIIPVADTVTPTEFDQVFNIFNGSTRAAFRNSSAAMANALHGHEQQFNSGIQAAPGGLQAVSGFMADLSQDQAALSQLVRNGDQVTGRIAAHRASLETLIGVAADTFDTFARRTQNVQRSIEQFAPTLTTTQATLGRVDTSIGVLNGLITDLGPGAKQLIPLAQDLQPALRTLRKTLPDAISTVRTGTAASPDITNLLTTGVPFMKSLAPALAQFAPQFACVRPYAPEFAYFLSNWASFTKSFDSSSHYARVNTNFSPTSNNAYPPGVDIPSVVKTTGITYAMPRPPGFGNRQDASQVWLLPQCGVGASALDPAQDPEVQR